MNFEVGKYYRARNGQRYRILATDCNFEYPIVAVPDRGICIHVTKEGCWGPCSETEKDLVAEWVDPPVVDWAAMPKWAQWVWYVEIQQRWFWSKTEPVHGVRDYYVTGSFESGYIPSEFAPTFTGRWQDSLVERPKR